MPDNDQVGGVIRVSHQLEFGPSQDRGHHPRLLVGLLWVLLQYLLDLELVPAGQLEEVVHPVGGGRLEDRAPDQGPVLRGEGEWSGGEGGAHWKGVECSRIEFPPERLSLVTAFPQQSHPPLHQLSKLDLISTVML